MIGGPSWAELVSVNVTDFSCPTFTLPKLPAGGLITKFPGTGVGVEVGVGVFLGFGVFVLVAVDVAVAVGVAVAVAAGVGVVVADVELGVAVGVVVGKLLVEVGVAVGGSGVPLPFPFMLTLTDFWLALLPIVSLADFLPSDDGVKTTDTSQLPSAAKDPTHIVDGTNSGSEELTELISIDIGFGL